MLKEIHVFPNSLKIRNCKDLYGKPFKCSEVVTVSLVQYRGTNGMTLPTDDIPRQENVCIGDYFDCTLSVQEN